jgi:hypothetical protein
MKTKALIIFLTVILVVLLVALLMQSTSRSAHENPSTDVAVQAPGQGRDSQESSQSTSAAQPESHRKNVREGQGEPVGQPLPAPAGNNLQQQMEELSRQRGVPLTTLTQQLVAEFSNAFSQELNRPIEFYGKAVDESGLPLKEATVTIRCLIFPEKQITTNISTDANGLFALQGVAGQALVAAVKKEDYEEVPGTNVHHFAYYGVPNGFQPDRYRPVVFVLRKKAAE